MFHIRRLELIRWDYWQRFEVSLDAQIVTVVGPNGSGKTTLLDSLRTLLGLECSGRRNYKTYVRHAGADVSWLRALVDNRRLENRRHPFWPMLDEQVTLVCRIQRHGGEWSRQYLIESGNVAIEQLTDRKDWLGVQEYRRRLGGAGLTPAIAQVLSLEQGDTDRLCEYAPRTLLDLVFQVFGDQLVLDNYRNARQHQNEAERELSDFELALNRLEASRALLDHRLNNHLEWQRLCAEKTEIEQHVLPVFAWVEQRESLRRTQQEIKVMTLSFRQLCERAHGLSAQLKNAEDALSSAEQHDVQARHDRENIQQAWADIKVQLERVRAVLRERDRLLALSQQLVNLNYEQATSDLGRLQNEYHLLGERIRVTHNELSESRAQLKTLEHSGRIVAPTFVNSMRQRLDEQGINHRVLADVVEVLDAEWQGAAEALLAPYRYVMLIDRERDLIPAMQIGETLRYRHFVTADRHDLPNARAGTMLEVVQFLAPVPAWVAEPLNRFRRVLNVEAGQSLASDTEWITRDAYVRERRGGRSRYIDPSDWQLGEAARRARLSDLQRRMEALEHDAHRDRARRDHVAAELTRLKLLLGGTDAEKLLRDRADEFTLAEEQQQHCQRELDLMGTRLGAAIAEQDGANQLLQHARLDYQSASGEYTRGQTERLRLESMRHDLRQRFAQTVVAWRQQRSGLAPQWREPAYQATMLARFESLSGVRRALSRVEEQLAAGHWETDENLVMRREKLSADLTAKQSEAARRQLDNTRARQHTDDARAAYIDVLRTTIRRYARNLKSLGDLAGVRVETDMPHLENDDDILSQAGLTVRFNFDDKGMIGMNDGEASGGQQVMKSLILLVALLSDDAQPGGFVFIDEPFAHLDVRNIQRVGSFLRATRAQYIVTTPVTHHVEIYDPTDLTLITRKKAQGARWAEPIAMLQRRVEAA